MKVTVGGGIGCTAKGLNNLGFTGVRIWALLLSVYEDKKSNGSDKK